MVAMLLRLLPLILLLLLCGAALAQERPLLPANKFDGSHMHRQNLCERQRMLFEGNIELGDALRGLNLTVVLTDYAGTDEERFFALDAETGGIKAPPEGGGGGGASSAASSSFSPGVFAVLLDEVARRAGFRWRDSFGVVTPLNSVEDGNRTWADLLEWETENFDLSVERWARSVDRMARSVSFPEGWYDASIIMVSSFKPTESAFNMWSFLTPFETGVWFLIVATIFFTGFMYWVLTKVNGRADERNLASRPFDAVFLSALTFTGHFEFRPNTVPAHLLSFSWSFWALIIAAAYTANLASFLVVRNTPEFGVSGIDDAITTQMPVCIFARAREDDFITKTYPKVNLVRKETKEEVFLGLKNGDCRGVITQKSSFDMYERNTEINDDCSMKWSGKTILLGPSGFATAVDAGTFCTSLVTYVVNLHMVQMKSEGFVDDVWDTHMLNSISDRDCSDIEAKDAGGGGAGDSSELSIKDVGGIFVFHVMVSVASLFIALVQLGMKRRRRKRERTESPASRPNEVSPKRQTGILSGDDNDEWEESPGEESEAGTVSRQESGIWTSMSARQRQLARSPDATQTESSGNEERIEPTQESLRPRSARIRRESIWQRIE